MLQLNNNGFLLILPITSEEFPSLREDGFDMQKVKQLIFAGLGIGGCVCIILASVFKIFPFVFILLAAVMFVGVVILGITILLDNQRDTPSSR